MNRAARAAWAAAVIAAVSITAVAAGQMIDVERASSLIAGSPSGRARSDRADPFRTGRSRLELPSFGLHTAWRLSLGALVEHAPLVDARGITYVVGTRGEVAAVSPGGAERWRASTNAVQPGPATLLSDDTLVFVDSTGDALAVREGLLRWKAHFGRSDVERPAPVPLADGGVVVATGHEIAALDNTGRERGRIVLPEGISGPLLAALGKIVFVGTNGSVSSWTPGAPEPTRLGAFDGPISEGAALADDHTLVAISASQTRILTLNLLRGTSAALGAAPLGVFLGPPATQASTTYVLLATPASELLVGFDEHGGEIMRTMLTAHALTVGADGGPADLASPPHAGLLLDGAGAVAFATSTGAVGVASARGAELLPEACTPASASLRAPAVAGLALLEDDTFVCACTSGMLLAIQGRPHGSSAPKVGTPTGERRPKPL